MAVDTRALLALLSQNGAKFILVGGWAAIVHGAARSTLDLDIVYERSRENIQSLARAFGGIDPYLGEHRKDSLLRWTSKHFGTA